MHDVDFPIFHDRAGQLTYNLSKAIRCRAASGLRRNGIIASFIYVCSTPK